MSILSCASGVQISDAILNAVQRDLVNYTVHGNLIQYSATTKEWTIEDEVSSLFRTGFLAPTLTP
jgi:hypothetical protein